MRACAGQRIDLSVRINDFDEGACAQGTFKIDFPNSAYEYVFSTTSTQASFSGGVNSITVGNAMAFPMPNPCLAGDMTLIQISTNATLTIDKNWSGTPIVVNVTINDLGGPLGNHTGNPVDPSVSTSFIIRKARNIPKTANRVGLTPLENTWQSYNIGQGLSFNYAGLPKPPPKYSGLAVIETFKPPIASGIFTKSDILPSWIATSNLPSTITADDIAPMLFLKGNGNTFTFDKTNQFVDTHAGFALMPGIDLTKIFTLDAIKNKRVGYRIDQNFECCGNVIMMDNQISRRVDLNSATPTYELKKKH